MTTSQRSINIIIVYVSQCSDVSDYIVFVAQSSATIPLLATMMALQVPQSSQVRARVLPHYHYTVRYHSQKVGTSGVADSDLPPHPWPQENVHITKDGLTLPSASHSILV